jgi:hypothetical protein
MEKTCVWDQKFGGLSTWEFCFSRKVPKSIFTLIFFLLHFQQRKHSNFSPKIKLQTTSPNALSKMMDPAISDYVEDSEEDLIPMVLDVLKHVIVKQPIRVENSRDPNPLEMCLDCFDENPSFMRFNPGIEAGESRMHNSAETSC